MKKRPEHLKEFTSDYSNFDHRLQDREGALAALHAGTHYIAHPAWDHWGAIWFENGKYYEQVMRFGSHLDTVEGDTIDEVFRLSNESFGEE